jgi:integrase
MKLTIAVVAKLTLPEGKTDQFFWDDDLPGFGVRLRGQHKTWVIQYRVGAQQRRESLDVRKIGIEDARRIARNRFAQIELGTDPTAEKAKQREAARTAKLTLAVAATRYLEAKADRMRSSTYQGAKLHLNEHWKPLHGLPLGSVTRADVAGQLQQIIKERGRVAAARARSNLSAFFAWAMREGLCESNPTVSTNNPAEGIEPRSRVLSDAELAGVWRASRDDTFGRITKLLILTACRRDEIGGLRWDEINGDVATIGALRSKNKRPHTIPLSPPAMQVLAATPRRDGRDHVFGDGAAGFNSWHNNTTALRLRIAEAEGKPLPRFTLHDLRRTAATRMAELGVQPHIVEAVLNHVSGHKSGVAGIYNRATYAEPMRIALQRWADHVAAIVEGREGGNVTPLRRGANG